jgi:hypothetical protein
MGRTARITVTEASEDLCGSRHSQVFYSLTRPSRLSPCGRFIVPLSQHDSDSKPRHGDLTVTLERAFPNRIRQNGFNLSHDYPSNRLEEHV